MTRRQVLREMIRQFLGLPSEIDNNAPPLVYGRDSEAKGIAAYEIERGVFVEEIGFAIHDKYPFLGASPDGRVAPKGLLEVKCPFGLRDVMDPTFKPIAEFPHYLTQVRMEAECCGADWVDFVQWNQYAMTIERVEHDPEWLPSVIDKFMEFMDEYNAIINDEEALAEYREELYVDRDDADWKVLAEQYNQLKQQESRIKAELASVRDSLIDVSGGKNSRGAGITVTKGTRTGSVLWHQIPELQNIDLEQYRREDTEYWRVSVIDSAAE